MEKIAKGIILALGLVLLLGSLYFVSAEITAPFGNINLQDRFGISRNPFSAPSIIFSNNGTANGNGLYSCSPTEDCTNKINSAIQSLNSQNKYIFFKAGTYLINNTLVLNQSKGVKFCGETRGSDRIGDNGVTTIKASSSFASGQDMISVYAHSTEICNLVIYGNTSLTRHGIALYTGGSHNIHDLWVGWNGNSGIYMNDSLDTDNTIFRVSSSQNVNNGIWCRHTDNIIDNYFARANGNAALLFDNCGGTLLTNSHVYGNKYSLYMNGTRVANIVNNAFETSTGYGVVFDSDNQEIGSITYTGNNHYGNNASFSNIFLDTSNGGQIYNVVFTGNIFHGTGSTPIFNYSGTQASFDNLTFIGNDIQVPLGNYPNSMIILGGLDNILNLWNAKLKIFNGSLDLQNNYIDNSPSITDISSQKLVIAANFNQDNNITNTTYDSASGIEGTNRNATYYSSGGFNNGAYYYFNGNTGTRLNFTQAILDTNLPFTYLTWVKIDGANGGTVITHSAGAYPYTKLAVTSSTGKSQFRFQNNTQGNAANGLTAMNDSNWHQIAAVFNGTYAALYQDGEFQAGFAIASGFDTSTRYLTIGASSNGDEQLNGSVDEVRVYQRALSATEVKQAYNKRIESKDPSFWSKLSNFPVACPAGSYITLLGTSTTCSTVNNVTNNLTVGSNGAYTIFAANSTSKSCSAGTEGAIYYDGSTKKHYGCNSTTWNALY